MQLKPLLYFPIWNIYKIYPSIFLLTFLNISPHIASSEKDSKIDLYNGWTINLRNPSSFFAITISLSRLSINGDKGKFSSAYFLDCCMNSKLTRPLHCWQIENYFVEAPKSLEWISIAHNTFSSSKSSFLNVFFFYSYLLSTLKCSFISVLSILEIISFLSFVFSSFDKKSTKLH